MEKPPAPPSPHAPHSPHRSRRFFYVRVTVLLTLLAGVLLYAWRDVRMRRARNAWDHTLAIAIVVVEVDAVDADAIRALRARVPALQDRMSAELTRYRPSAPHPFLFTVVGPAKAGPPPPLPAEDGAVELAQHALALSTWQKDIDARVGLEPSHYDSRIYLTLRRPTRAERTLVEGRSEQGGRSGVVEVELDVDGVDLALIVVAHELLHTLGATDKYDASGRTIVPVGLAEPDRAPLYPQRFAEIMARNRPLSASDERVPGSFDEVAVGPATAREIGWSTATPSAPSR